MRKSVADRVWPAGGLVHPPGDRIKRALDVVLAGLLLVLTLPLVFLAALAIRLETPGPAFFVQTRVGWHGRRFRVVKLRTLHAGRGRGQVLPGDPRITRVGYWLRRTSLDELPQVLNVLRGEMSLVGPRPYALRDDLRFERLQPGYDRRRLVRPGITGWAQVNACRGPVQQPADLYRRTRFDLAYVAGRSLLGDLVILLWTLGEVVRRALVMPPRD